MKSKFNKEINDKLNDLFIFTKDNSDLIEYTTILNLVEDLDISTHKLKYHLKYNYCMSKQVGGKSGYLVYVYTGLKFRNNH